LIDPLSTKMYEASPGISYNCLDPAMTVIICSTLQLFTMILMAAMERIDHV